MIRHAGTWTPAHRAETVWHHLPFDVPASCPGVRITLEFDRSHGPRGVLDLGLVDPQGWRGWSGGARSVVELGRHGSTPGYLDRGLPSGEWQVVLGLHRLPAEGLAWEVVVDTDVKVVDAAGTEAVSGDRPAGAAVPVDARRPPVPDRPPRRDLPSVDGLTWLPGDCHAHTVHSDGSLTIDELAALAAGRGLDFLWVTDHNTTSHHPFLAEAGAHYGIDLLPGQEVTTADGHANAFGDMGWVDFRRPGGEWSAEVTGRGGLLSVNHPVSGDCAWRHPRDVSAASPSGTSPAPAAEVWHSSWTDLTDGGPLAWWVAAGSPIPLGGSDFHRHGDDAVPGSPTTWVACADGDVLGGMVAGRTAVSAGPGASLLLRLGEELIALDADGTMLVCPDGRRSPLHGDRAIVGGHEGPHLLERTDRTIVAVAA